jgi:SprT protein
MSPVQSRRLSCRPPATDAMSVSRGLLPPEAEPHVEQLLARHAIHLRLSRPRRTKLGDHRPPGRGSGLHRITVNEDLNPYSFLTTLLHEIAHVATWERHRRLGRRLAPHGQEWKQEFGDLLRPVVAARILPAVVEAALSRYLENPAARSCSDRGLVLALAEFDPPAPDRMRVEDLDEQAVFKAANGSLFRAGRMIRSRRQCFEIPSGCEYRVHGLLLVEPVSLAAGGRRRHDG